MKSGSTPIVINTKYYLCLYLLLVMRNLLRLYLSSLTSATGNEGLGNSDPDQIPVGSLQVGSAPCVSHPALMTSRLTWTSSSNGNESSTRAHIQDGAKVHLQL